MTSVMPEDVLLIRHGKCHVRDGENLTPETAAHSADWPLDKIGIGQMQLAREYLEQEFGRPLTGDHARLYSGFLVRQVESARELAPEAEKYYFRSDLDGRSRGTADLAVNESLNASERTHWNEEDYRQLDTRATRYLLGALIRQEGLKRAFVVLSRETILRARAVIEGWTPSDFFQKLTARGDADSVKPGQIIHYTRRVPDTETVGEPGSGVLLSKLRWVRSILPGANGAQVSAWHQFGDNSYSAGQADQILAEAAKRRQLRGEGF